MLGLFTTLVFAAAGCASAAIIAFSLHNALPAVRRLAADRRALAEDGFYLITLIETPRHDGTPAPLVPMAIVDAAMHVATRTAVVGPLRRRAKAVSAAPLRAAA